MRRYNSKGSSNNKPLNKNMFGGIRSKKATVKHSQFTKEDAIRIGTQGEIDIATILGRVPNGKVIRNVYIKNKEGELVTEIDLILLHPTGIYVIESKNYTGYICYMNNMMDKYWLEVKQGGYKRSFYNPILQNQGHVKSLVLHYNWTHIANLPIYSYVVFGDKAILPQKCCLPKLKVLNLRDLGPVIIRDIQSRGAVLNNMILNKLAVDLDKSSRVSKKDKERHIDYINKKYKK